MVGIGQVAVKTGATATKFGVFSPLCVHVVGLHRGLQGLCVDACFVRQLGERLALEQITVAQERTDGQRCRLDIAQAIFAQGLLVAHQPHGRLMHVFAGLYHRQTHIVVRIGFVGKATTVAQHTNHTGLVAVQQMRKHTDLATAKIHWRHRHPGRAVRKANVHHAAGLLGHIGTIARVAHRGGRQVRVPTARMGVGLGDALEVVRETATGKHHGTLSMHLHFATINKLNLHTCDAAIALLQIRDLVRRQNRNAKIQRRLRQPSRQRIAAGDLNGATVQQQFAQVVDQAACHVHRRRQRLGGSEKVFQISIG